MSEELAVIQEGNNVLPNPNKEKKPLSKPLIITAATGLVITIVLSSVIYSLNTKINSLTQTVNADMKSVKSDLEFANGKLKIFEGLNSRIDKITNETIVTNLMHDMEGWIVTDDFSIQKIFYRIGENNSLSLIIDLNTQPDVFGKYKGKGSFDLQDRELRIKATAIINAVKDYYTKQTINGMPKWDENTKIKLTIKNYDIGKLEKGEFILTGEK